MSPYSRMPMFDVGYVGSPMFRFETSFKWSWSKQSKIEDRYWDEDPVVMAVDRVLPTIKPQQETQP